MKQLTTTFIVSLLIYGCVTNYRYYGSVVDCYNNPIPNAKVEAWIPGHSAIKLDETLTDKNGSFLLNTELKASYFSYYGYKLVLKSHPEMSESKCEDST